MPLPVNSAENFVFRRARISREGVRVPSDDCSCAYDSRLDLWPDPMSPARCLPTGLPRMELPISATYPTDAKVRATLDNACNRFSIYLVRSADGDLTTFWGLQLRAGLTYVEDIVAQTKTTPNPASYETGGLLFTVTLPQIVTSIALTGRTDVASANAFRINIVILADRVSYDSDVPLIAYGTGSLKDP